MSRTSTQAVVYPTLGELERSFLNVVRRYRRANQEIAARNTILLSGGDDPDVLETRRGGPVPVDKDHERVELMHNQVTLLRNMSAQVLTSFSGDKRGDTLRRNIDALAASIEEQADALVGKLGQAARRAVDRTVVVRNHMLMETLRERLGRRAGSVQEMYLTGTCTLPGHGSAVACDVAYLRITNLRGPDGFTHPTYYVATAHPEEGAGAAAPMYVSVSPDYRLPARLRFTATARNPNELQSVALDALVGAGVTDTAFTRELPVAAEDIKFVHANVKRTSVDGNTIKVSVKNKAEIEETRQALRRQLTSIVRRVDPRNRDVVRDRVDASRGIIMLTFSLPGRMRGRVIDPQTLRRLADLLDLDRATLQRVKTAIEDPE